MTKEKLEQHKKNAFQIGLNDTVLDDIVSESAQAYIDSNITEELNSEENEELINEYTKGFISGYQFDNPLK